MRRILASFMALFYLFFSFLPAQAETLRLKNGDSISGHIKTRNTGEGVLLHSSFGQDIYIKWHHIHSIDDIPVQTDEKTDFAPVVATHTPPLVSTVPLNLHITKAYNTANTQQDMQAPHTIVAEKPASAQNNTEPQAVKDIEIAETSPRTEDKKLKFSGRVNFGSSLQTGNSEKSSINADTAVQTKKDAHRFEAKMSYNRAKDEGDVTVDNTQVEFLYDYFFRKKWFLNSNIGFERDKISDLDSRMTFGLGLGHQVYESDDLNLKYSMGTTYINEEFSNNTSDSNLALSWALDYNQKVLAQKYDLFHNHKILSPFEDTGAFLFESTTGLRIPLIKNIIGTAEVQFDWDNDPPIGTTEDDTIYSMKLGYEW